MLSLDPWFKVQTVSLGAEDGHQPSGCNDCEGACGGYLARRGSLARSSRTARRHCCGSRWSAVMSAASSCCRSLLQSIRLMLLCIHAHARSQPGPPGSCEDVNYSTESSISWSKDGAKWPEARLAEMNLCQASVLFIHARQQDNDGQCNTDIQAMQNLGT